MDAGSAPEQIGKARIDALVKLLSQIFLSTASRNRMRWPSGFRYTQRR